MIGPNMIGLGLYIAQNIEGGVIINYISMGSNCSVNVGVVVGNNGSSDKRPIIGDNVALTTGCKLYGKIRIGNNVTIAPNSVVFKDLPDNAIATGIPAYILKKNR